MGRFTITGEHQASHEGRVGRWREEPAKGRKRLGQKISAHGRAPYRSARSLHMPLLLRHFIKQDAGSRRVGQNKKKQREQTGEENCSNHYGEHHNLYLDINNLADNKNPQQHHDQTAIDHVQTRRGCEQDFLVFSVDYTD